MLVVPLTASPTGRWPGDEHDARLNLVADAQQETDFAAVMEGG